MNAESLKKLIKKRRIYLFIIGVIVIGIIPIPLKGIQFGMDFRGGTMMDLKLNEEVDPSQMTSIVNVLNRRVNAYGLKDVSITPQESQYIRVEVAETDPAAVDKIKSIIGQQGNFETLYEGKSILNGSGITEVITNPQKGYGARKSGNGYRWSVPFQLESSASQNFADAVEGECTQQPGSNNCKELLYMYIDRPDDGLIVMNESMYQEEKSVPVTLRESENPTGSGRKIPVEDIVENSGAELLVKDEIDQEVINKSENRTVIVPPDTFNTEKIDNAKEVREVSKSRDYWISDALNLENIVHLTPDVTSGNAISTPSITGFSQSAEDARTEINRIQILLKSGKLPVGVQIEKVNRISPLLGQRFLKYSLIAGVVALISVAVVVSLRYLKWRVVVPLLMTSFSEVVMTVGAAAWIGWQIDLAAIAGIIAVVGTGVDHQIIMTDEALRKTTEKKRSLAKRIKKAFSIIMRSSITTIFAMFPLLFMGLGSLQGFAIVTIIGSLIGVLISRPAYGAIINEIL